MVSYEVSGSAAEGYAVYQVEGVVRRRVLRVLRMEQGLPRGHVTTSSAGMTQEGAETVARGLRDGTYAVDAVGDEGVSVP